MVVEAQHQEGVVDGCPGLARDEGRIAVEGDSRLLDRIFRMRTGDDSLDVASHRRIDGGGRGLDGRSAVHRAHFAQNHGFTVELMQVDERDGVVVRQGPGKTVERHKLRGDATGLRVALQGPAIADEDGVARRANARVERRFERDLGADAGLIAERDRDLGQAVGHHHHVQPLSA